MLPHNTLKFYIHYNYIRMNNLNMYPGCPYFRNPIQQIIRHWGFWIIKMLNSRCPISFALGYQAMNNFLKYIPRKWLMIFCMLHHWLMIISYLLVFFETVSFRLNYTRVLLICPSVVSSVVTVMVIFMMFIWVMIIVVVWMMICTAVRHPMTFVC